MVVIKGIKISYYAYGSGGVITDILNVELPTPVKVWVLNTLATDKETP